LKNVRIIYTKKGRMKFVSHLDMTRFMSRSIKKAGIPVWYTEGFHPHLYLTFALPLSLGFESDYEVMDIRLIDDSYPLSDICKKLNEVFPKYIRAFKAEEPVTKTGKIAFADFKIEFNDEGYLKEELADFLNSTEIICQKKTKKGGIKEIDLIPKIKAKDVKAAENTELYLTLPAGSEDNLNPELLLNAFYEKVASKYFSYSITRTMIYDTEMQQFK